MISLAPLQQGNTIAIVATARKVSPEEMQPAIDILKSWGLNVVTGKNLYKQDNQFAGTDAERAADFQWVLNDKNIQAILFARGGYGTVRMIDGIDFSNFQKNPKWLIGFSDITVFHSHVHTHFGIETLHSPMAINFPKASEETLSRIKNILFGKPFGFTISGSSFNRKGNAKGIVIGGNLSLLFALAGTASDIDPHGKILFIEDLDEYLYHIDRMMMQLKRSGKLKNLAGLIVGGMSDMRDNTIPFGKTAEEIISEHVAEYNYPVCFNFPAGHIANNQPLILGREVELMVSEDVDFSYLTHS